jgi:hypothetical protein
MTTKSGDDSVTIEGAANTALKYESLYLHSIRSDSLNSCKCKFGLNKICVYKSNQ